MKFLDREPELAFLEERHRARGAELVVLWGRRRVGKTALLTRFAAEHGILYHLATRSTATFELERFSRRVGEHYGDAVVARQPFRSWDVAFRWLAARPEPPALVLDELPYLAESDPSFGSVLQAAWDELLQPRGAKLYLCGSSIAMVERLALSRSAPLYGRRTGQWRVEPLRAWDLGGAFRRPFPDLVRLHATVGGVPYYLSLLDPKKALRRQIAESILRKGAALYEEVPFLLREELREPRVYFAILATVAQGAHRFGEISSKTGLDRANMTRYLGELAELGLLRREVPVTETSPAKSRLGLYRIADPFTRFWFRFVQPNVDLLELGRHEEVVRTRVLPAFEAFVSLHAEEVVRDALCDTSLRELVPFDPVRRGRYWGPEAEIDVLLLDAERRRAFAVEVKWSRQPLSPALLDDLRARLARVAPLAGTKPVVALASPAGFRPGRPLARDERLIDLRGLPPKAG